jgi:hypothetical protein
MALRTVKYLVGALQNSYHDILPITWRVHAELATLVSIIAAGAAGAAACMAACLLLTK